MIAYDEFTMDNGLRVIVHQDKSTPIVAFNLLYDVGSKDEDERRTGFAHLFEHLMFSGSANIPEFDKPLQEVGGENNAFTSTDVTNYYITLPKGALETAFWLESDRMLGLAFSKKGLDVQRQVVVEEFKQRYLNQPYGDVYLLIRPLAYKSHPYQWATIGKEISHIEDASMAEVKSFFNTHYLPNNAILSIAGDVELSLIKNLTEKWFGGIPQKEKKPRKFAVEAAQTEARQLTVERDVPLDAIYLAFHMVERKHSDYYASDLISDILSRGDSSRFYIDLIKKKKLFAELDAYVTGELEQGLFIVGGKLNPGVRYENAEKEIRDHLQQIMTDEVTDEELIKVKNKVLTAHQFGINSVLNKAMGLAMSALIDSPNLINEEVEHYHRVKKEDILRVAQQMFQPNNCSTLYYKAKK